MRRRDLRRRRNERREREREGVNVQAVTQPPRVQATLPRAERPVRAFPDSEGPRRGHGEVIETKEDKLTS